MELQIKEFKRIRLVDVRSFFDLYRIYPTEIVWKIVKIALKLIKLSKLRNNGDFR